MELAPLIKNEESTFIQKCHIVNFNEFQRKYEYENPQKPDTKQKIKQKLRQFTCCDFLITVFPIISWIQTYHIYPDLLKDFVAGFSVATMHISQGMAYATLAGVDPIVGIYMAFFPVLIYVLMGTSRHNSMGSFAVVCIMAGKPVMELTRHDTILEENSEPITPLTVAVSLTFVVGLWQVILGILRLGSLSVLFSETLVSSFTSGAAILVCTSQIKHVFGISIPQFTGPFKPVFTLFHVLTHLQNTNLLALGISLFIVVTLVTYNTYVKGKLPMVIKLLCPIEFLIIITGTMICAFGKLDKNYNLNIIGHIPTGLPELKPPPLWLIPKLWVDGLVIATVSFTVNISMASIFAQQDNYEIDANQELMASGCGNLFGSFFSCLPFTASLSRSVIQKTVGGVTQIASLISSLGLLLIMMYFGKYFEHLPYCVLSGIILASLKTLLMKVLEVCKVWKQSHFEGCLWIITYLSVVLLDIDKGLMIGLFMSVIYLVVISQTTKLSSLGQVPNTDIYLDMDKYHKAVRVPRILILHLEGQLTFANSKKLTKNVTKLTVKNMSIDTELHTLILDMSGIIFIDHTTTERLKILKNDLLHIHKIQMYLVCSSDEVHETLVKFKFVTKESKEMIFHMVHDAVLFSWNEDAAKIEPQIHEEVTITAILPESENITVMVNGKYSSEKYLSGEVIQVKSESDLTNEKSRV